MQLNLFFALLQRHSWCILQPQLTGLGDKWVYAFLKGISPKVNIIVQFEFEPAYYGAVHQISHNTKGMTPQKFTSEVLFLPSYSYIKI